MSEVKLYTQPNAVLVGKTDIVSSGIYEFLKNHDMGWLTDASDGSEYISEFGGRICYMSFGAGRKTNKEYLDNIIKSGHGSVLEHGVWNFAIWGVSRSLTHELVRHRAGAGYSQLSQRYVDESVAEYVVAPLFNRPELIDEYKQDMQSIHNLYLKWADKAAAIIDQELPNFSKTDKRKNARQAARYFLPNATETKLLFTCNTRALRHVIEMRASEHADVEIRNLAMALLKIVQPIAPNLFGDYEHKILSDGTQAASTSFSKV
jgi:thymidylate synthase (FAD)